jgi:hypothetical protein
MFILLLLEESNAQKIEDVYGLNGQIEHKIAFLRAHVPKDVKLILIGHSVGTYMTLHVMKRVPELPVSMPLKVIFFFFWKAEGRVCGIHLYPHLSITKDVFKKFP